MGLINPILYPNQWDAIVIAGVRSPGIATVNQAKRHHEWDVKRGKGAQGATITYQGIKPASFTVTIKLWQVPGVTVAANGPDDFVAWAAFTTLLRYNPSRKAIKAIDIYHPSLEEIGIRSVVVEHITNIEHKGGGLYEVEISFLEYLPPPKSSAIQTPSGSDANRNTNPKTQPQNTDANLTAQQLLVQLQTQAQSPF